MTLMKDKSSRPRNGNEKKKTTAKRQAMREHLQRGLRDWKGAARGVEKAVSDAELDKTALSRQIRLASGRGQADVEELGHALLEDSKFRLCSSGSGRGASVQNRCTCERERWN